MPAKSQWDFGDLFPVEQTRKVLSVSELTQQIKRLLEKQIARVWVTGEISNLRAQSSGHIYFTLKDAGAQLACVLFRGEPVPRRDLLQDGQKVLLNGEVTVYEARGQHQLIVREVELRGVGALQLAFEKLKQKLQTEGLFASERKRPLPRFIQRIGLVTSPTGAAICDVLTVVHRRHAGLAITLAAARVQGEGAALEIAQAVRDLNAYNEALPPDQKLDLILLTRGGGSLEDLWAFNEESVARAIFESALPVVSAVGHEVDYTISDFVADERAPTPSAAAEIITEGMFAARQWLPEGLGNLCRGTRMGLEQKRDDLAQLGGRLARCHPQRRLQEQAQRLDDLQEGLLRCARRASKERKLQWQNLAQRLMRIRPATALARGAEQMEYLRRRLIERVERGLETRNNRSEQLLARLRLLSPEQTLARGYSITADDAGRIIRDAAEIKAGQRLKTRLHKGEVRSVVEE
jgi:exodeoxyribonuclease VII large subunit